MPPPGRLIRTALVIGAVPMLVQAALLAAEEVALPLALAAMAVLALMSLALAWFWLLNIQRLLAALRAAAAEEAGVSVPFLAPRLPAVREIEEALTRLARSLQARAELVMRLRAADEAIVENLPDPLIVLSAEGTPLRANAAARRLFGLSRSDPAGGGDLAALLRHPTLAALVDRALAEGRPGSAELRLPVPVERDLLVQAVPMELPLGDGGRLVLMLSDRTEARAIERMRADFVANASHELRSPLASLIGFIETLQGPAAEDAEARQRFLAIMAGQAQRMKALIDDLLSLSRIELMEHLPPTGRADAAALLRAEVAAIEPLARGARILIEAPESLPISPVDPGQLAQVIRNLLDNALRHGRPGGEVRVSLARIEGGPRLPARPGVLLTVQDDGPGIPREHIPRLTERFYRVDAGRARSTGGTGLGLAIVKHIVNRHRGQLLIESEVGHGACFKVWLPTEEAAPAQRLLPA
ncbi:MAG: ATP-binding protein [Rhodovarius sp.]|nr:ATP-binding protein [Rhodovarius sp.]MCX7932247.1 ATP-binding protein [Rhodovarius sp.]MDW8315327.1 ATP-binding protein [Rhodovarius sp.]